MGCYLELAEGFVRRGKFVRAWRDSGFGVG